MLTALLSCALSGLIFFILHVTGAGSFPRPLTAEEERNCLERLKNGCLLYTSSHTGPANICILYYFSPGMTIKESRNPAGKNCAGCRFEKQKRPCRVRVSVHGRAKGIEMQMFLSIYLPAFPWFATLCILAAMTAGSPRYSLCTTVKSGANS